jgi:dTMP kinase
VSALLVAIEGIDGSGKGTQAIRLRDVLSNEGLSCGLIAFPRYDATTFGRTIAQYLNGEFGDLATVGPHFAALLYAGDRFESLPLIRSEIQSREILVFDRYVPSNIAHQAAKLPAAEREPFIAWVESIEYGVYQLPRPDRVIYLDVPVETAQQLISRKPRRQYTARAADLHEADAEYLRQTAEVYRHVAARDPAWRVVNCCDAGNLRTPEALSREICDIVRSETSRGPRSEHTK